MTTPRDPDALLAAYLAVGMEVLSDRVVDSILDEVHRTRQRPCPLARAEDPTHVQDHSRGGGGRRRGRRRWCVLRDPTRPARDRRSQPDAEHAAQPQPSGRRGPKFGARCDSAEPARVPANGRHLDRHRDDGHASLWPHGGAAPRWPGARGGRRQPRRGERHLRGGVRPGQRDVVRHREAWSGLGVASRSRPRCCATARCSWGMAKAQRCTTRKSGPGPSPGRWL